jgi:predicted TIM-barrel fold metal-dependent hydrolase
VAGPALEDVSMRIVDAHHHLWDLNVFYYPWLTDRLKKPAFGDYAAIRKNYLLGDFLADASGLDLVKSVHIQGDCELSASVAETRWLQGVADGPNSRGFPHAIVAYADLSSDDADKVLSEHCQSRNMRGVRQMLHHSRMSDPAVSPVEYMAHAVWLKNLDLLQKYKLSFDMHLLPEQMSQASEVIAQRPGIQFIVCHAGSPFRRGQKDLEQWRDGLQQLARHPNVSIKISGLGMYDLTWTVDSIRPFVVKTIEIFGVDRCMFASNFPVDKLMSDYASVWRAFDTITKDLNASDREKLFAGNAERFYRI